MIRFANISRAADGLELSATTDLEHGFDLKDCKKYMKSILRKSRQFPIRSFMNVGAMKIYFYTDNQICSLMICNATYPMVLAYGFLNDIHQEFLTSHSKERINRAARPYSFIEFDSSLQRAKQRYNNTRTLTTTVDVSQLNEMLKNDPPYEVSGTDVGFNNAAANPAMQQTHSVATIRQLEPLSWIGMLGCLLAVCCCVLNIIRFVPFWNVHAEHTGYEVYWIQEFLAFVFSALVNCYQCYLILHHVQWRNELNILLCVANAFLVFYLRDLRNEAQIVFLILGNVLITYSIWNRHLEGKKNNYNV